MTPNENRESSGYSPFEKLPAGIEEEKTYSVFIQKQWSLKQ
jgi:hypothetical protein